MKKYGPFTESDAAFAAGAYEPEVVAALTKHCRQGATAFDIGANVGYHTLLLSCLVGEDGHVHAFEPVPSTATALERTLELNGVGNVTVHRLALGDEPGSAAMRIGTEAESGRAHFIEGAPGYRAELSGPTRTIQVPVTSIDALIATADLPPPDLVKIDAEGAELLVLKGMRQTLCRARPVVLTELWGRGNVAEANALFASVGHTVSVLSDWQGTVAGARVTVQNVLARAENHEYPCPKPVDNRGGLV